MVRINAKKLPIKVSITASYPRPSKSILCPGKTERAVSASGAPKKIDGIVSRKLWVMDIDIMNTAIIIGDVMFSKYADRLKTIKEMRFMWTPGINPVKIPKRHPRKIAIIISMNMLCHFDLISYYF